MIGRKAVLSISIVCALAVSALAATGATGAPQVYECGRDESGPVGFIDAHCVLPVSTGAKYRHKYLTGTFTAKSTNANTASETTAAAVVALRGQLAGVVTEIQCTGAEGMLEAENHEKEEFASGTMTIEQTGCSVTAPAGKGCVVIGGTITTKKLALTTKGQAANSVKVSPAEGTELASVPISKCAKETPPANNYLVSGSFVATASGGVFTTTHAGVTTQGTLEFGGVEAGLKGAQTVKTTFWLGTENGALVVT